MSITNPKLELKLDPKRLAIIIDSAVVTTSEIVNFHFSALSNAKLDLPAEPAEVMYRFRGPDLDAAQRRSMHERWLLARAFHDLLRAVRHAFEEAYVFVTLLTKTHQASSNVTLSDFLKPFQSKAAAQKFPDLLAAVNEKLQPKLEFADAYKSLQLARNCLEHRDGIISKIETRGADKFNLRVPRIKLFYMRGDTEIEIEKGGKIEAGDDRANVEIFTKLDVRERTVNLGSRLTFTLNEFNEIAFACHFLGTQLASNLPKPAIAEN